MSDSAVMQGTYSDLKTIRSRKVVQMVVEFPIEAGAKVVETFGFPNPGEETWVAVARLQNQPQPEQPEQSEGHRAKKHFEAACSDANFCMWLDTKWNEQADLPQHEWPGRREFAKVLCGVQSANEIIDHPEKWRQLWNEYSYGLEVG